MKNIIYIIALAFSLASGCTNKSDQNQSISIRDTKDEYTFEAIYPKNKTEKLEKYLDSTLNNQFHLNKHLETEIDLGNHEHFALTTSTGILKIKFLKIGTTLNGYLKVKKLAEGIKEKLK